MGIGNVVGFGRANFYGFISHHVVKLSVGGMPSNGLGLARSSGVEDFALGETLVALADGLNHGHGGRGVHIKGEAATDAVSLAVKDDFFGVGSGDNPLATGLVAVGKTIILQLGEGEKIGNAIAHEQ